MPENVKLTFKSLKTSTLVSKSDSVDTHQYWIDAAKDLGLADCVTGSGVVFRRDPTIPSPADSLSFSTKTKIDLIFIQKTVTILSLYSGIYLPVSLLSLILPSLH